MKILIILTLFVTPALADWTLYGKIVKVHDGDGVVRLLDSDNVQHKIRLAGIDAPELGQAFGRKSKKNLLTLIGGRQMEAYCHKIDKYGRDVCQLIIPDTITDINLAQVKAGLAWHYKKYASEQSDYDRSAYAHAEMNARNRKLGLWQDKNPIPPWEIPQSK